MQQQPFPCLHQGGGGWLATVHHRLYVCRYVCVFVWGFTLETSCRPVRVPAASSPRGPLVFRCRVRRISNCVRWGISVRIDRSSAQHSTAQAQGAKPSRKVPKSPSVAAIQATYLPFSHPSGKYIATYLRPRPSQSKSGFMSQQLPKPQHQPIDKR